MIIDIFLSFPEIKGIYEKDVFKKIQKTISSPVKKQLSHLLLKKMALIMQLT